MWIKLLLKKEDVEKAININNQNLHIPNTDSNFIAVTKLCPIFQSLKRQGLKPISCSYNWAELEDSSIIALSERARRITNLNKHSWLDLLEKLKRKPMEFSIRAKNE